MRFVVPVFAGLLALVLLIAISACTGFGTAEADQARAELLRDEPVVVAPDGQVPPVMYPPGGAPQMRLPTVTQGSAE